MDGDQLLPTAIGHDGTVAQVLYEMSKGFCCPLGRPAFHSSPAQNA
jgi:hypothetical protein